MRVSQEMVSSLHFSTTVLVIFLTFRFQFRTSSCMNDSPYYEKCSKNLISFGNITKFGYPFWGDDWGRPISCGHPAMKLEYPKTDDSDHKYNDHKYLILRFGSNEGTESPSFPVIGIKNFTVTISLLDLYSPLPHCLSRSVSDTDSIVNALNSQKWLTYSSTVKNITVTYDCDSNRISVGSDDTTVVCGSGNEGAYCKKDLRLPVLKQEFDDSTARRIQKLEDVLSKGFEVEFLRNYSELCFHCRHSGGECGSSESDYLSKFTCYCKNGEYPERCAVNSAPKLTLTLAVAIPVGIFTLTAVAVSVFWCAKHKFQSPTLLSRVITNDHIISDIEFGNSFLGLPVFSYTELQEATNNFERELGDGGFGVVYYGKLRDGREIAVKRLYERNYRRVQQFRNEVEILTKLSHTNLVTLYGCSSRHSRELLLVYEYISNGTVADHLYGNLSDTKSLNWSVRMKIAIQTSEALSYLHASDIIHRDIKTNNILLDGDFTVKVADFGLSRLFPTDVTHISTAPQGTPGYLDPEYNKCYQVTEKSDVFSFGVVLVELISSLPAIDFSRNEDEINLSNYAVSKIQNGKLDELVDRKLGFELDFKVKRMVSLVAEVAFQCLHHEKEVRPSMKDVLEGLKRIESIDYEELQTEEMKRMPRI